MQRFATPQVQSQRLMARATNFPFWLGPCIVSDPSVVESRRDRVAQAKPLFPKKRKEEKNQALELVEAYLQRVVSKASRNR